MSPAQMFGDISSSLPPEPWQGAWSLGRGVGCEGQRDNKSPVRTMASCGLFSASMGREGAAGKAAHLQPKPLVPSCPQMLCQSLMEQQKACKS